MPTPAAAEVIERTSVRVAFRGIQSAFEERQNWSIEQLAAQLESGSGPRVLLALRLLD